MLKTKKSERIKKEIKKLDEFLKILNKEEGKKQCR